MGIRIFQFFQREYRLYTSESDVYRRQILAYKDGRRAERVKQYCSRSANCSWATEVLTINFARTLDSESEIFNVFITNINVIHIQNAYIYEHYEKNMGTNASVDL